MQIKFRLLIQFHDFFNFFPGLFWLNAAETWVDIKRDDVNAGILGSMFGSSAEKEDQAVHAHFMSEAGIIDFFVLLGPSPKDVSKQYAALTGPTPIPPMFSIAYHQCRWNYNDQEDVRTVAENVSTLCSAVCCCSSVSSRRYRCAIIGTKDKLMFYTTNCKPRRGEGETGAVSLDRSPALATSG